MLSKLCTQWVPFYIARSVDYGRQTTADDSGNYYYYEDGDDYDEESASGGGYMTGATGLGYDDYDPAESGSDEEEEDSEEEESNSQDVATTLHSKLSLDKAI